MTPTASTPEAGGRARSTGSLRTLPPRPAAATAPNAATVARGRQRRRQSPAAPSSAISGHLTHQADASNRTNVSGSKRTLSPTVDAALSHACTLSSRAVNLSRVAAVLEDHASVVEHVAHADAAVQRERGRVLRPHEQAHGRGPLEQEPAEVTQRSVRVAVLPGFRVHPHLLELNGGRRPRRRLRLEQDHPVFEPDPRAAVLDLCAGSPAEAFRVAREWVHAELLLVRECARGQETTEVLGRRGTKPGVPGRRRILEREDRLTGSVLAWDSEAPLDRRPQLADRALLADDHPRARALDTARETVAAFSSGHDVHSEVAERGEPGVSRDGHESPEPAPRDVFEEDALHRLSRAERKDLLQPRFEKLLHRRDDRFSPDADPRPRRARRLRGGLPPSGRPAPRQVHRRDVLRQSHPPERGAGDVRLHGR